MDKMTPERRKQYEHHLSVKIAEGVLMAGKSVEEAAYMSDLVIEEVKELQEQMIECGGL